jgi:hypothetical protein
MSDPIEDYIRANRDHYPREALTEQMVAAGHDRAAIDAAWGRLSPTPPPTWEATAGRIPDQIQGPIVVRTYRAKSQAQAAQQFQADAGQMAAAGYYPVSQSWAQGQWGCGAFLLALVLCIVLIGFLIFIYLLVVKPDGTLTVTYQFRAPPT